VTLAFSVLGFRMGGSSEVVLEASSLVDLGLLGAIFNGCGLLAFVDQGREERWCLGPAFDGQLMIKKISR